MLKQKNKQNGITLIALVVTIIVLIILAGVSIGMLVGKNGIVTQAQKAKRDTEKANLKEKLDLIKLERELNQYTVSSEIADETDIFLEMMGDKEITQEDVKSFNDVLQDYDQQLITISNAADIQKIGIDENYPLDGLYILLDNISLEGQTWTPIGTEETFTGIFNGNHKIIDKLTIDGSSLFTGLFAVNKGSIKNIILTDVSISSQYAIVGGVVGSNTGRIENCHTQSGTISEIGSDFSRGSQVGGICGRNSGVIQNCTNASTVTGKYRLVGGICGYNYLGGDILNCENTGEINGTYQLGGIVGISEGIDTENMSYVRECTNYGDITQTIGEESENLADVGGIVGINHYYSVIERCNNEGIIIGEQRDLGGIAGSSFYIVQECENIGKVENVATNENYARIVGGIVGSNTGNILKCKNTGNIIASSTAGNFIGGIVGHHQKTSQIIQDEATKVEQCGNTGAVTGSKYLGGIAGRIAADASIISCLNTGEVNGSERIGGIVGDTLNTSLTISNVYNQGTITASNQYVGGIVGILYSTLENAYNTGTVSMTSSSNTTFGGITGYINTSNVTIDIIQNCYYLDTSFTKAVGNISTIDTSSSKTSEEIKALADTLGEGFKTSTEGDGYPKLSWE